MYVCVCQGVTERQIREAVEQGARSMRALRKQLGVTAQCGKCAQCVRCILDGCRGRPRRCGASDCGP